jgi:hypothetical protein
LASVSATSGNSSAARNEISRAKLTATRRESVGYQKSPHPQHGTIVVPGRFSTSPSEKPTARERCRDGYPLPAPQSSGATRLPAARNLPRPVVPYGL